MAIQGTQVPMYTNTYYFCIFQFLYFLLLYVKKKKTKTEKKTNKNKSNKKMYKTRLTQDNKTKHTSNAKQKYEEEREEVTKSLGALFLPHLGRAFPLSESLN